MAKKFMQQASFLKENFGQIQPNDGMPTMRI